MCVSSVSILYTTSLHVVAPFNLCPMCPCCYFNVNFMCNSMHVLITPVGSRGRVIVLSVGRSVCLSVCLFVCLSAPSQDFE